MGFFDNIANKFTEKPEKKLTLCKDCNHLCHGYPVEKRSAPLAKKLFRLAGAAIGGACEVPGGGPISESVAKRALDTRMKNGKLIVYEFKCDDCGREFFRIMPCDEVYYLPTVEEEKENNKICIELLREALEQKYEL